MDTPICDFIENYIQKNHLRLHMPGHKGESFLGIEKFDITEVLGADSLYEANGIIKKSEENASEIFGAHTFYSTEGSSLCIKAMLYLAMISGKDKTGKPYVIAGRNAHKAFLSAAALLDFDIKWIYGEDSYLSCKINSQKLDEMLIEAKNKPFAVYITSPDYLGNISDIKSISKVCKKHDVMLVVDNAHGAYLKFLNKSLHPIDEGADMCCDSAHKTLTALTGGAYLHISKNNKDLALRAKDAMLLFGSTSPSYLILASLDKVNCYLKDYRQKLQSFLPEVEKLKETLISKGFKLVGTEPLKLTVMPKSYGYTGSQVADKLRENQIECEFSDPDFVVLMLTPETKTSGLEKLKEVFNLIEKKEKICKVPCEIRVKENAVSIRQAYFSQWEECEITNCEGRVLADSMVGCPPAVALVMCGEIIDKNAIESFEYYGIKKVRVIK